MKRSSNTIKIRDHYIGSDKLPFVIAEMSGNHNQSFERAMKIVEAAAKAGAEAAYKRIISLPIFPSMRDEGIEYVVSNLSRTLERL